MKFYEFNDFRYYALISARTEKEAIMYYKCTVADVDINDGRPDLISEYTAKSKLLDACIGEDKHLAVEFFDKCLNSLSPNLILIDGGLM